MKDNISDLFIEKEDHTGTAKHKRITKSPLWNETKICTYTVARAWSINDQGGSEACSQGKILDF